MEFSRHEYWSGFPRPLPGNLLDPEIRPAFLMSPALAGRFFTNRTTWEAHITWSKWTHFRTLNVEQRQKKGLVAVPYKLASVSSYWDPELLLVPSWLPSVLWADFPPFRASLVAQLVKNPPAMWETWVWFLGWEDPWRRERLPTPVFWPREFSGLYSPWRWKESHMMEWFSLSLFSTSRL